MHGTWLIVNVQRIPAVAVAVPATVNVSVGAMLFVLLTEKNPDAIFCVCAAVFVV